jgi:hypothetical protein
VPELEALEAGRPEEVLQRGHRTRRTVANGVLLPLGQDHEVACRKRHALLDSVDGEVAPSGEDDVEDREVARCDCESPPRGEERPAEEGALDAQVVDEGADQIVAREVVQPLHAGPPGAAAKNRGRADLVRARPRS